MAKNTAKKTNKRSPTKSNAKTKRKALGRGLSSLMGAGSEPVKVPEARASSSSTSTNGQLGPSKETPSKDWREKSVSSGEKLEGAALTTPPPGLTTTPKQPEVSVSPKSMGEVFLENAGDGFSYQPIGRLVACESQPRKTFAQPELQALADSITQSGLLQPILVRELEGREQLEIVAGERRFRAAQPRGLRPKC